MKNIYKNIIVFIILGSAILMFKGLITKSYFSLQDKLLPCTRSISYSIGKVDVGFGISREDFLTAILDGESMWEKILNKDLLVYKPEGGELVISLVYDKRQKITDVLKGIDLSLQEKQDAYSISKSEVDILKKDFEIKKNNLENTINTLKDSNGRYTKESILKINNLQAELNEYLKKINQSVNELNKSVTSLNDIAKQYNDIGNRLGDKFEEGLYYADSKEKYIDIYQFGNKNKLERVLMHEIGHALSLNHVKNPDAIMYEMNIGTNLEPTEDDINALKTHCGVK